MAFTLQNSINFAQAFIQYSPLTAGNGMEPAVSIASMIRNTMMNPPLTWYWNRAEISFSTSVGVQDYTQNSIVDLSFIETVSLTDDQGEVHEIKDIYNTTALGVSSFQQRPNAISVQSSDPVAGCVFRFLGVPDKIYLVTVTYQKIAPQFGPFLITSSAAAIAGSTVYTGFFNVVSFPNGSFITVTGYTGANVVNNGVFAVSGVSTTTLTLSNAAGVVSTQPSYAVNLSWAPVPDQLSDVYNNLFLSEALASVDDNRAQVYRQRGVAAFLTTQTGLSDMQKNAFTQQWLARDTDRQVSSGMTTMGNTARGV